MTTAFLFPGQGSQSLGMMAAMVAEESLARDTFTEASDTLGLDLWQLCQAGPEADLNRTENTQPVMLAADIATWRVWRERGGALPGLMAGHSLGEYAALVAAESLSFEDAITLVAERGRLMQTATPEGVGAMAAILGLDDATLEALCAEQQGSEVVSCANYNAPGQIVIAGHSTAVTRTCEAAREAGARRALPLPVSVPSHCHLMREAADQLTHRLSEIDIAAPRVPVVHNADVETHNEPDAIRAALSRQLWQPVRWTMTIQSLVAQGVTQFVECGPGKVLTGLNRRIDRSVPMTALIDGESINALRQEMKA